MTCAPTGDITAPPATTAHCHCGAVIRPVPRGDTDWAWIDDTGQTRIDNVQAVLAEERRIREEIHTIGDTPAWNRYCVLGAQLGLAYVDWGHSHSPTSGAPADPPPWCCGEPMQAVPAGWRCRATSTIHPYRERSGRA